MEFNADLPSLTSIKTTLANLGCFGSITLYSASQLDDSRRYPQH